jgi:hypothetical protein
VKFSIQSIKNRARDCTVQLSCLKTDEAGEAKRSEQRLRRAPRDERSEKGKGGEGEVDDVGVHLAVSMRDNKNAPHTEISIVGARVERPTLSITVKKTYKSSSQTVEGLSKAVLIALALGTEYMTKNS